MQTNGIVPTELSIDYQMINPWLFIYRKKTLDFYSLSADFFSSLQ